MMGGSSDSSSRSVIGGGSSGGSRSGGSDGGLSVIALVLMIICCLACCCSEAGPTRTQGRCMFRDHDIPAGGSYAPLPSAYRNMCVKYSCEDDGAVTTHWCSHVHPGPNCHLVGGSKNVTYPACCPEIVCY